MAVVTRRHSCISVASEVVVRKSCKGRTQDRDLDEDASSDSGIGLSTPFERPIDEVDDSWTESGDKRDDSGIGLSTPFEKPIDEDDDSWTESGDKRDDSSIWLSTPIARSVRTYEDSGIGLSFERSVGEHDKSKSSYLCTPSLDEPRQPLSVDSRIDISTPFEGSVGEHDKSESSHLCQTSLDEPRQPSTSMPNPWSDWDTIGSPAALATSCVVEEGANAWLCSRSYKPTQSTPSATTESEGENSFIEGWEDHQSPSTLEIENEVLFTYICDSLSRQLTNTYIASLYSDQSDVQQEASGYNSCARSGSSATVSQISKDNTGSSKTTAPTTEPALSQKRGYGNDEEDDQSGDKRRKRPRLSSSNVEMWDGKLLACPYFKYDPTRYSERNTLEKSYRGCSSCFLKDISRLKQHLYRVHRRPDHYCGRCSEEFESQDSLDTHTRATTLCDVTDPQYFEKMTSNQLTRIKRRSPGRSSRDTWYFIFKILFPDAPLPNSPFAECVSSDAIAAFILHAERQGPALLSELIATDLQNLPFYRQHDRQILDEAMERAFLQVIRELNRQFSQSSSHSDVSSFQSALPSSPALREVEPPTTPHETPPESAPNTTSALSGRRQSTYIEPPQLHFASGFDPLPQPDFLVYQDPSVVQAGTPWDLVPSVNSADIQAFLAQSETQPLHAGVQSQLWEMPHPSSLNERHVFGGNIYTSNEWPSDGPHSGQEQ